MAELEGRGTKRAVMGRKGTGGLLYLKRPTS